MDVRATPLSRRCCSVLVNAHFRCLPGRFFSLPLSLSLFLRSNIEKEFKTDWLNYVWCLAGRLGPDVASNGEIFHNTPRSAADPSPWESTYIHILIWHWSGGLYSIERRLALRGSILGVNFGSETDRIRGLRHSVHIARRALQPCPSILDINLVSQD